MKSYFLIYTIFISGLTGFGNYLSTHSRDYKLDLFSATRPATVPFSLVLSIGLNKKYKINPLGFSKLKITTLSDNGIVASESELKLNDLNQEIIVEAPKIPFSIKVAGTIFFCETRKDGRCYLRDISATSSVIVSAKIPVVRIDITDPK
jgi:hypothetical protein